MMIMMIVLTIQVCEYCFMTDLNLNLSVNVVVLKLIHIVYCTD